MPTDFNSLTFGFLMLGQLVFFSAYGGNVPPPPVVSAARRFEPGGGGMGEWDGSFVAPCPLVIEEKTEDCDEFQPAVFQSVRRRRV